MAVQRLSHVGLCVSDLDRSTAFYRDALGFTERSSIEVAGTDAETLVGLEERQVELCLLVRTVDDDRFFEQQNAY